MKIRLAVSSDLPAIMEIEQESFGEVGAEAMASEKIMFDRIALCNGVRPGWFWVAEVGTAVCGYLVMQPMSLHPDDCVSWERSTDNGTLKKTFDKEGETILGVSLGVRNKAPSEAFYFLVLQGMLQLVETGKKRLMLCSRLPSLASVGKKKNIPPEEYWKLTDKHGNPRDPLLRKFYQVFGVQPYKFMPNGFMPDAQSGGHGALIVVDDPHQSIALLSRYIDIYNPTI